MVEKIPFEEQKGILIKKVEYSFERKGSPSGKEQGHSKPSMGVPCDVTSTQGCQLVFFD